MCGTLNRQQYEVEMTLQAADQRVEVKRLGKDTWQFIVTGIPSVDDPDNEATKEFVLTDAQAAATLALFVGDDALHKELSAELYLVAEMVWKDVPQHFRIIP